MKKKLFLGSLAFVLTLVMIPFSAFAETGDSSIVILDEATVPNVEKATLSVVDPSKVNSNKVQPMGTLHEVYDHTEYSVTSNSITAYNVGPLTNETFTGISVPYGSTTTISTSYSTTATVQVQAGVSADLFKIINISLSGNASGSVTSSVSVTGTYSGPASSTKSHRDYYYGTQYDQYTTVVHITDVYKQYNGDIFSGYIYYDKGTQTTKNKKPKTIFYGKDF